MGYIRREENIIRSLSKHVRLRILLQKELEVANHADKCAVFIDKEYNIKENRNEMIHNYFDINTDPYSIV